MAAKVALNALLVLFATLVGAILFEGFIRAWVYHLERKWMQRIPDCLVVSGIVQAVGLLMVSNGFDFDRRVRSMRSLEQAARAIEAGLPARLKTGDWETDAWLTLEMRKRASGLREIKKLIALMEPDMQKKALSLCESALSHILQDDWKALPTVELSPALPAYPASKRAMDAVRRSLIVLVPLIILAIAEFTGWPQGVEITTAFWTGAVVWAVVGLMTILDPSARDRISAVKESADALRNLRTGKS